MGKHSNIILINNSNIIIDAIRRISSENALRTILPANPYIYPTSSKNNLLEVNINQFLDLINSKHAFNVSPVVIISSTKRIFLSLKSIFSSIPNLLHPFILSL